MSQLRGCPRILQSGNRRGLACGRDCYHGEQFCRLHQGVDARAAARDVARGRPQQQQPSHDMLLYGGPAQYVQLLAPLENGSVRYGGTVVMTRANYERHSIMIRDVGFQQFPGDIFQLERLPHIQFSNEQEFALIRAGGRIWHCVGSSETGWNWREYDVRAQRLRVLQPSSPKRSLLDDLVGCMIETGKSTITKGECPICFNDETDIISYPCHDTHHICFSCLEANFKSKNHCLVCPHCRTQTKTPFVASQYPPSQQPQQQPDVLYRAVPIIGNPYVL